MSSNLSELSFETTPAAQVSLACCQSLCDLLKELPLPTPTSTSGSCLSSRLSSNVCQNFSLINSQLESALSVAKDQLSSIVFVDHVTGENHNPNMSPLAMQMSMKGLFFGHQNSHSWNESNSLETIEPSLRTSLEFDDSLKLIDDCLQNDCNDTDVKYFNTTSNVSAETEEDSYSSLGERVKSRQRLQQTTVVNDTPQQQQNHNMSVVSTNSVNSSNNSVLSFNEEKPQNDRNDTKRHVERQPKKDKEKNCVRERSHSSHKNNNHNISHDFQNKDSLMSFECIINKLMTDCDDNRDDSDDDAEETDTKNDMSFDLRIDLKELNLLMSLSSKLKHSNKTKDLESRLSSKLTSFLSLLTNKMIVWFSKFKETEEYLNQNNDDMSYSTSDDNVYWQLLINSSKMSLNLMTSKGMSSRVVLFEELLEIIINFLSHNLNSKTHVSAKTSPSKKSKASSVSCVTSATKRQVTHWTELLELLTEYLSQNKCLNDSIVLMITRISLSALLLNATELQTISVSLISAVFRQYPKHRNCVLEELLHAFPRIPLKREKGGEKGGQSVLTRLLIQLTNQLFDVKRVNRETLAKALTDCLGVISSFLSSLVKRCLSSASESELKSLMECLVLELLSAICRPKDVSSLLLIQILTKLFVNNLKQNCLQLRLNSIEFLSIISSNFAKLLHKKQEILTETETTLSQLTPNDQKKDRLLRILPLLNQFFVCEKLLAEKTILMSLWVKEKRFEDISEQFFRLFSETTPDVTQDDDPIDATTATLFLQCVELQDLTVISRLFDATLSHVTSSLSSTQNTTQRSRAMKSLSAILVNCSIDKSTELLARADLQMAMRSALLDSSTSVREATIDLIGRFVLQSHDEKLCSKYWELISERILDTGVSVRKRVIRILRDICLQFPRFDKCADIQLRIIKRVNDEGEGIRKLVQETVRELWFKKDDNLGSRVMSLLQVISVMLQTDGAIDSLAQLLEQIAKQEPEDTNQAVIDFLIRVLIEETSGERRAKALKALSCAHLIALFSHMCPHLLAKHVDGLQSLLSLSCDTLVDIHLRNKLIESFNEILPKLRNPSQALIARLEEDLTKQILQSSALILPNCVKCLATVIESHTNNQKLSQDLFHKLRQILINESLNRPKLLRAIYSLGLFLKHFKTDFPQKDVILERILHLIEENLFVAENADLVTRCITSLGFIVESDPRIGLQSRVIDLYSRLLTSQELEVFCSQTLQNFRNYLSESIESDEKINKEIEWSRESLKTMTSDEQDHNSIQSQIIQTYLTLLLDKSLSASTPIRRVACNVVHVIQTGGHVHPLQLVPHLIAMTTDDDSNIRSRADHVLHEIERKFHGFVAMKAKAGIELALRLCARLQCRGFRLEESSGDVTSRLSTLYHVICTNRQSRRGFVQQLLRSFEMSDTSVDDTLTTGDDSLQLMFEMVLFFPFTVCDEVLYILQQLECIQSVNSTQTSQLFSELFGFQTEEEMDDKFDDSDDAFTQAIDAEVVLCKSQLMRRVHSSLIRVFLVIFLRKLLKEFYLLKDEKILEYSPNEAKVWEKPIHRRHIESSNLNECLLKANPNPILVTEGVTIDILLEEFRRFKSVSMTSVDTKVSNQWIQQKLFTVQKKPQNSEKTLICEKPAERVTTADDLNDAERKRLLESIRKTQCQVSLIDIGIHPSITSGISSSMSGSKNKREKSPKKEKKVKKKMRIESDSDDSPDDTHTTDESNDSDDKDFH